MFCFDLFVWGCDVRLGRLTSRINIKLDEARKSSGASVNSLAAGQGWQVRFKAALGTGLVHLSCSAAGTKCSIQIGFFLILLSGIEVLGSH